MSDVPRGPLDHEPDELGWWQASDGRWYPPESLPTSPVPVVPPGEPTSVLPVTSAAVASGGAVAWVKRTPLWAKIAVPVAVILLIAGIAGGGKSTKKTAAPTSAAPSPTIASTTTTTLEATTEPSTTTVPITAAPITTAPSATTPPVTAPRVTTPPATAPPAPPPTQGGPANPGDSKNCTDFATYAQAKAWFDTYFPKYGDVAHLDADHDGIPCESLPGAP